MTRKAYDDCASGNHPVIQIWQKPEVIVGGFVVTVSLTAVIICATHAMGACK